LCSTLFSAYGNCLSLHPDKTKFILFSNSKATQDLQINIFINNNNLDQDDPNCVHELLRVKATDKIPAIKYLGVYFDPILNFKFHIEQVKKKLSKALFTLRHVKNILPPSALKSVYFSLIHSHLIYACKIWSSAGTNSFNNLYLKQQVAICLISNAKYNAHTEPLFSKLKILKLPDLVHEAKLKFMFKVTHNLAPISFANTWPSNI
jgi:hypothetical protein